MHPNVPMWYSPGMSLREIRWKSGLMVDEVLSRLRALEPSAPSTRNGLMKIETRGTTNVKIIRALAGVYGLTAEEIEQAAAVPAQVRQPGRWRKFCAK